MKIILIGAAGSQGREYYNLLHSSYQITGVVDTNYQKLHSIYKESSMPLFHTTQEALEMGDFDIAVVCIPHSDHFSVTRPLLEAGKLVIKEKPLALAMHEVEYYKKQEQNRLFTIVQREFHEIFDYLQKNLYLLGKVYDFSYQYYLSIPQKTSGWRTNFHYSGGGVLIDMGYHVIDVIVRLFGYPSKVTGAISYCYDYSGLSMLEDAASLTFSYPNHQLQGSIRLNRYYSKKKEKLEIIGSNGSLIMNDKTVNFYDRKGKVKETLKLEDKACRKKMFQTYLEKSQIKHVADAHLDRHANIVKIISDFYQNIRQPLL